MEPGVENDRIATRRAEIGAALQQTPPPDMDEGSLVTGWVIVAEWMTPEGERRIEGLQAETTTGWLRQGLFYNALHEWPATEEED